MTTSNYEECLQKAHTQGWRDPVEITNMEIRAYEAGMKVERRRVLSIFKHMPEENPLARVIDLERLISRVRNPNNPV